MMHADRLSELPDSLQIHILSLMEMKDAVKTGILSKRWKHLWTQTQNVVYEFTMREFLEDMSIFKIMNWKHEQLPHILSFIDRTLLQCVSSMKKFSLRGFENVKCIDRPITEFVDRWIAFVSTKNVESLNMDLYLYPIPDIMFTDFLSLKKLELYNVSLCVVSRVNWPLLKDLELGSMSLGDATIENILLGCPRLETIVLNEINGINHLNVMSPSVQSLTLFDIEYEDGHMLEIKAPWLQEFVIDGHFCVLKCRLVDLSSLSRACLTFITHTVLDNYIPGWNNYVIEHYDNWTGLVIELLRAPMCRVGELVIGSELIQVLSMLKLLGKPSPSFNWKKVKINSPIWKYDLPGIQCLLESARDLETLIIKVDERKPNIPFPLPKTLILHMNRDPLWNFPEARLVHLKYIKVDYSINPLNELMHMGVVVHGVCFDFELLTYILRSAVALERLVIVISMIPSCYKRECLSPWCVYQYVEKLSSTLLATSLAGTEGAEWKLIKTKTRFEFSRSDSASTS